LKREELLEKPKNLHLLRGESQKGGKEMGGTLQKAFVSLFLHTKGGKTNKTKPGFCLQVDEEATSAEHVRERTRDLTPFLGTGLLGSSGWGRGKGTKH